MNNDRTCNKYPIKSQNTVYTVKVKDFFETIYFRAIANTCHPTVV